MREAAAGSRVAAVKPSRLHFPATTGTFREGITPSKDKTWVSRMNETRLTQH